MYSALLSRRSTTGPGRRRSPGPRPSGSCAPSPGVVLAPRRTVASPLGGASGRCRASRAPLPGLCVLPHVGQRGERHEVDVRLRPLGRVALLAVLLRPAAGPPRRIDPRAHPGSTLAARRRLRVAGTGRFPRPRIPRWRARSRVSGSSRHPCLVPQTFRMSLKQIPAGRPPSPGDEPSVEPQPWKANRRLGPDPAMISHGRCVASPSPRGVPSEWRRRHRTVRSPTRGGSWVQTQPTWRRRSYTQSQSIWFSNTSSTSPARFHEPQRRRTVADDQPPVR